MNETGVSVDTRPDEENVVWRTWTGVEVLPDLSGRLVARIYLGPPTAAVQTALTQAGYSEDRQFPSTQVFLSSELLEVVRPNLVVTDASMLLAVGTLYGNAPDADTSHEVVPRALKREVVSAIRRQVQASGLPFHVRSVVDVDRESGWRELLIEITVDAAPETRDELWSSLCDALDDQIRTWPESEQQYGPLIGIAVRPTARRADV